MTAGQDAGAVSARSTASPEAPPDDTGEAIGLPPSGLTLTDRLRPDAVRDADGKDRFGLAGERPAALADLPQFPGDSLDPEISGGDICVQACANDPQVAVHAIRNLARIGIGVVSVRWSQLGFGRTSSTSRAQATPRNLFGFKDGTDNLKAEDTACSSEHALGRSRRTARTGWSAAPTWSPGKIRMIIETWDRTSLGEQETIIGRTKGSGAPLGKAGRVRRARLRREGRRRRAADRRGRARPAGPPAPQQRRPSCCAAATTSSTAPTDSAGSTPGCSSSPTSATRASSSSRCSAAGPART